MEHLKDKFVKNILTCSENIELICLIFQNYEIKSDFIAHNIGIALIRDTIVRQCYFFDDLKSKNNKLKFKNGRLEYYENRDNIYSINAYLKKLKDYSSEAEAITRQKIEEVFMKNEKLIIELKNRRNDIAHPNIRESKRNLENYQKLVEEVIHFLFSESFKKIKKRDILDQRSDFKKSRFCRNCFPKDPAINAG